MAGISISSLIGFAGCRSMVKAGTLANSMPKRARSIANMGKKIGEYARRIIANWLDVAAGALRGGAKEDIRRRRLCNAATRYPTSR